MGLVYLNFGPWVVECDYAMHQYGVGRLCFDQATKYIINVPMAQYLIAHEPHPYYACALEPHPFCASAHTSSVRLSLIDDETHVH